MRVGDGVKSPAGAGIRQYQPFGLCAWRGPQAAGVQADRVRSPRRWCGVLAAAQVLRLRRTFAVAKNEAISSEKIEAADRQAPNAFAAGPRSRLPVKKAGFIGVREVQKFTASPDTPTVTDDTGHEAGQGWIPGSAIEMSGCTDAPAVCNGVSRGQAPGVRSYIARLAMSTEAIISCPNPY